MTTSRSSVPRVLSTFALALVAATTLTGCGSSDTHTSASAPATTKVTAKATATTRAPSATASPTRTTPSSSASTPHSYRSTACRSAVLAGAVGPSDGAAGSELTSIILTNTGTSPCTLQGWPGVSLVGHGDGKQLGAAADQDRTGLHATLTIAPGARVHAPVRIVQALNYPRSTCHAVAADGFRVYPPGETKALFIRVKGITACSASSVHLLTVKALQAGRS